MSKLTKADVASIEAPRDQRTRLLAAALSGLSPNSCRVYRRHLNAFLAWIQSRNSQLTREIAVEYLQAHHRIDTSTYNQALSAIKRLANQSAENLWLSWHIARSVDGIPARKQRGTLSGHWLSLEQASALLHSPNSKTLSGRRDRAVLALLLGCGLRRDELSRLTVNQIDKRDGRTMLCNVVGKGNRVRDVAVPGWADDMIRDWWIESGISAGPVVRSFTPDGRIKGRLSVSGVWGIVEYYAAQLAITCTPHDLRRTYAKLARKAGAPLEVIQKSLGHSSIGTTERYMNTGEGANAGDWIAL